MTYSLYFGGGCIPYDHSSILSQWVPGPQPPVSKAAASKLKGDTGDAQALVRAAIKNMPLSESGPGRGVYRGRA
jgi:hypothetical protein